MAKVLTWMSEPEETRSMAAFLTSAGHEAIVASDIDDFNSLAKIEAQTGNPIKVAIVKVDHDWVCDRAFIGVHAAKNIQPPVKIIAICCCSKGLSEAMVNNRCAEALLKRQIPYLPSVIPHVLATA